MKPKRQAICGVKTNHHVRIENVGCACCAFEIVLLVSTVFTHLGIDSVNCLDVEIVRETNLYFMHKSILSNFILLVLVLEDNLLVSLLYDLKTNGERVKDTF